MPSHDYGLLSTLVISLVAAFAGGLAARAIRLPPLLGYILAGIAIGSLAPNIIASPSMANELAEIGVALMLFNIGLHFSFKDLLSVQRIALPGALIQITIAMTGGAFLAYRAFHTPLVSSLAIGLTLAIASTAIASRILDEHRQMAALTGRIALGWLVVQDMAVIVALILFPALAQSESLVPSDMLESLSKTLLQITGFIVVMVFGGRRVIPALLHYVARIGSRELFTLAVIVIALGIAYGSSIVFGVSLTMGAFFAGVVIGESDLNHHAATEALSMQQVFTILFFVSVGMLFDPSIVTHMPVQITAFVVSIVFGIGLLTFSLLLWMGLPFQPAALVAAAFAQTGEFSFVLSEIGFKEGLFGAPVRDMIMAAALLSIMINPLLLWGAKRLARWVDESPLLESWRSQIVEHSLVEPEQLEGHTILVGCGRVGSVIGKALRENGYRYIIIESDRTLTKKLRAEGNEVVFGDGARETVCKAAHPRSARLLIVAVADAYYAKQIIRQFRKINPSIDVVVRTHTDEDSRAMMKLGVGLAVMGEREIGFGMATYALFALGLSPDQTRASISLLRENLYNSDAVKT